MPAAAALLALTIGAFLYRPRADKLPQWLPLGLWHSACRALAAACLFLALPVLISWSSTQMWLLVRGMSGLHAALLAALAALPVVCPAQRNAAIAELRRRLLPLEPGSLPVPPVADPVPVPPVIAAGPAAAAAAQRPLAGGIVVENRLSQDVGACVSISGGMWSYRIRVPRNSVGRIDPHAVWYWVHCWLITSPDTDPTSSQWKSSAVKTWTTAPWLLPGRTSAVMYGKTTADIFYLDSTTREDWDRRNP